MPEKSVAQPGEAKKMPLDFLLWDLLTNFASL